MFVIELLQNFRTRDQKVLDTCDIVVDVGGVFDPEKHRYDHHQRYLELRLKCNTDIQPIYIRARRYARPFK
jgi:uncharacterized UPF0160 family protein